MTIKPETICFEHEPSGEIHPSFINLDYCKKCGALYKLIPSAPCSTPIFSKEELAKRYPPKRKGS